MKNYPNIQLITAAVLAIAGLILLFCGLYIDPAGEIHETVLVAYGEVLTFAGSLMGIDYHYQNRNSHDNTNPPTKSPEGQGSDGNACPPLRREDA